MSLNSPFAFFPKKRKHLLPPSLYSVFPFLPIIFKYLSSAKINEKSFFQFYLPGSDYLSIFSPKKTKSIFELSPPKSKTFYPPSGEHGVINGGKNERKKRGDGRVGLIFLGEKTRERPLAFPAKTFFPALSLSKKEIGRERMFPRLLELYLEKGAQESAKKQSILARNAPISSLLLSRPKAKAFLPRSLLLGEKNGSNSKILWFFFGEKK